MTTDSTSNYLGGSAVQGPTHTEKDLLQQGCSTHYVHSLECVSCGGVWVMEVAEGDGLKLSTGYAGSRASW